MRHRMRDVRIAFSAGLLALVIAGCGGRSTSGEPQPRLIPDTPTVLKVENNGFNDMRIYVYQGGQRVRVGTAGGKQTTTIKLAKSLVFNGSRLRFEAVPIGGQGSSVSEEISVSPGEEITIRIGL